MPPAQPNLPTDGGGWAGWPMDDDGPGLGNGPSMPDLPQPGAGNGPSMPDLPQPGAGNGPSMPDLPQPGAGNGPSMSDLPQPGAGNGPSMPDLPQPGAGNGPSMPDLPQPGAGNGPSMPDLPQPGAGNGPSMPDLPQPGAGNGPSRPTPDGSVSDAIEEKKNQIQSSVEDKKEQVQSSVEDKKEQVQSSVEDKKEQVQSSVEDKKDAVQDKVQDTKDSAQAKKDAVQDKVQDAKDSAQAKKDAVQDKVQDAKDSAQAKKDAVQDKVQDTKDSAQAKKDAVQDKVQDAKDAAAAKVAAVKAAVAAKQAAIQEKVQDAKDAAQAKKDALEDKIQDAKDAAQAKKDQIQKKINEVKQNVQEKKEKVQQIKETVEDVKDIISTVNMIKKIKDFFESMGGGGPATGNEGDFAFSCGGVMGALVLEFEGVESISAPFAYNVGLVIPMGSVMMGTAEMPDLKSLIGQTGTLLIRGKDASRFVNGVIEEFSLVSVSVSKMEYAAKLVPSLKPLEYSANCRIFQDKTTQDIIKEVLQTAGYAPDQYMKFMLNRSYSPRNYCVQYRESDWDFINRLMEEDGMFYWFDHTGSLDVMVVGDGDHAYGPISGEGSTINFRDGAVSHLLYEECFNRFRASAAMAPTKFSSRDFRFAQPSVDMEASAEGDSTAGGGEIYEYPGEYVDPSLGKSISKLRIEAEQADRARYIGRGTSRAPMTGCRFTLALHPVGELNREYVAARVHYKGLQGQALEEANVSRLLNEKNLEVDVISVPSDVIFRPRRKTRRPIIAGVQSAIVVGPAGETVHCDKFGRIQVKFHWDRSPGKGDGASCWIRPAMGNAGGGMGHVFLPRIGQEVIVQFIEGDPDRPILLGRVFNGESMPPYGLPGDKTISTIKSFTHGGAGFNELRFRDKPGLEEIFMHAERDFNIKVKLGNMIKKIMKGFLLIQALKNFIEVMSAVFILIHSGLSKIRMSADGTIVMSGRKITIEGMQSIELKSQNISIDGSSEVNVQGGVVKINC
ncbi:MAG: type VI secretion system tip protein TssI/VgrG [Myxococcota bacterium]